MKKLLLLLFLLPLNLLGQTQSWNTLNIKGKLSNNLTIAMEPESRYCGELLYFHLDVGLVKKINDKIKIGGYYREIFEIKNDMRVHEVRPHIDIFYKANKTFKLRIRNEYQIKEFNDNVWRIRFRPTYSFKINEWFSPFVQTEPFLTTKGLVRNRFNLGPGFTYKQLWVKPGYMLQTDIKNEKIKQPNIIWINTGLKF
jgi:hypothetical protein